VGADAWIARIEELVAGEAAGVVRAIPAGHFRHAGDRGALERYQEGAAAGRPFVVEHLTARDGLPSMGPSNVSGTVVESTHEAEVVVAYLAAGGSKGRAHPRGLTEDMAKDWRRIRRCLATPSNVDEQATGVMSTDVGKARIARPRVRHGPTQVRGSTAVRVVLMVVPLTALVREDWDQEP
jgi:hypothetical protein